MTLPRPDRENPYRFGPFTVDVGNFRLRKEETGIALTPRAFDVLKFLLENAGRVVEKQEIFDAVWKDVFVGDNALTKVVKEIRHALEDPADAPRYIETVPKRGYRFIGRVENGTESKGPVSGSPGVAKTGSSGTRLVLLAAGLIGVVAITGWLIFRQRTAASKPAPIRAVAVLPFKPLNAESRDESLEMGMAETLITRLSNLKQVVVRPFSAVRKYTDLQQDAVAAGREVQAEAVLEGSIQKAGDRVRVTVRLIKIDDGMGLWSEQFDESFTDIFKVQDSIAERITNALALELSRQEKEQIAKHYTDSPEAYELYLQGQILWHRRRPNWIADSITSYGRALEKDPNFALAHIGLADAYIMQSGHRLITMVEAEDAARPHILKALEIDDRLALAHNALAELKYQYEYDWPGAEDEFKKAVELSPNGAWIRQAYGWFLMSAGRFDEAENEMNKAQELDPNSLTINAGRGRIYYYSRRYDQAIRHYESMLALEPNDSSLEIVLYAVYVQKRMYPEAFELFLKCRAMPPEREKASRDAFKTSGWHGFLNLQLKYKKESAAKTSVSPATFADLYVGLGEKEESFYWLDKVFDARDASILQFKIEPAYDFLRDDPRYASLLARIGLKP